MLFQLNSDAGLRLKKNSVVVLNIACVAWWLGFSVWWKWATKPWGTACLEDPNTNIPTYELSVYVPKIYTVISVVPWRCPLGDFDWRVSLLIQWQWPVCQHTGLTKKAGHPCKRFLSCLSPRLLAALEFVFAAFPLSQHAQLAQTGKLRRLYIC